MMDLLRQQYKEEASAENKRRTGVGLPPNAVSSVEEKVAGVIGKTPINGIEGSIDTCVSASFEELDSCASVQSPEKSKKLSCSSSSILQAFPLISSDDDDAVDDVIVTQDMPSSSKVAKLDIPAKKFQKENENLRLIEIENERFKVERERLQIEKSRYEVEKDRYNLKMQKLEIEKVKLEMEKGRYNLELSRQQLQIAELRTTQPTLFQKSNSCVATNQSESSCDS
ncbi:uncharacterized protein [Mytilus edulis]|uniref:uncharacterized protein n=1 Tax=Mytilus edulis TaxID=6550 RepID=UPI0039F0EBA6